MAPPGDQLPAVGVTGVGVAAIRAAESARPDRLFDDPFAARFAEAAGFEGLRGETAGRNGLAVWIAVRTRFLDELVLDACAAGCRQVVILGAGLDARAFRLAWPAGTLVWELDLPAVLELKERVIRAEGWEPACRRTALAADLGGDWDQTLVAGGFDENAPVAWVAEGLLAYLTPEDGDRIVDTAGRLSMAGSRLGLTVTHPERRRAWLEAHPEGRGGRGDYVALWRSAGHADPAAWLASHGWTARVHRAAERARAYGRAIGEPNHEADGRASELSVAGLIDAIRD